MPGPKKNKRKPSKSQRTRKTNVSHQHLVRKYDGLVGRYNGLAEKLTSTNRYLISLHGEMTTLREVLLETLADKEVTPETVRDTIEVLDRILDPLDISMGETPRERELSSEVVAERIRTHREETAEERAGDAAETREELDAIRKTLDELSVTDEPIHGVSSHPAIPRVDDGEKVSKPDQQYG